MTPPWHTTSTVWPSCVSTRRRTAAPTLNWKPASVSPPGKVTPNGSSSHAPDAEPVDEVVHRHPVAVGTRVVLAEAVVGDDLGTGERLDNDLRGLLGAGEVAGDHQVGHELGVGDPPIAQPFGLLHPQRRQPAAGAVTADHS